MHKIAGLRLMSHPSRIADTIAQKHPDDAWKLVTAHIEREDEDRYYVLRWLSDEIGFKDELKGGAIRFFDPGVVMAWVAKQPEKRVYLIMKCLPKTLDVNDGGILTRLYIESYCGNEDNMNEPYHFWSDGYIGLESEYLMRKRDNARRWISEIRSERIQAWLCKYIDYLTHRIISAEIEEERRF